MKRHLYWHTPALYLLVLLYLLLYLIVALIVRKRMVVTVGLCGEHASRRGKWIAAAWVLFLGAIGLLVLAFGARTREDEWAYGLSGGGLVLLSLIVACIASNLTVRPRRITADEGTLTGAGEGYLRQFPEAGGAAL